MMMKELERYLCKAYINICQTEIINETLATFPEPNTTTTMMDTGADCLQKESEMTYIKKKNINDAIHQNFRKRNVLKTNMHKIYNLIMGYKNEQPQDN